MTCFTQKRMSHWCRRPVVRIITFPLPHLLFHFRINSGSFTFFGPSNFCPQYTRKPPVPSYCLNQQESAHFHCWHVFTSSSAFLSCPLSKQWILYAVDLITICIFVGLYGGGKEKGLIVVTELKAALKWDFRLWHIPDIWHLACQYM